MYGGSELSKHVFKLLAMDAKNAENPIFFYGGQKCRMRCVNVIVSITIISIDYVRSYLFFKVGKFRTQVSDSVCKARYY